VEVGGTSTGDIVIIDGTQTLTNKTLTSPVVNVSWDGWVVVTDTWTYASATTITVPSGAASLYQKGDKIKLTQTTAKYFYITTVADTLLTITGGSSYTLTSATITSPYYSKVENPQGFPSYFSYTPVVTCPSGTAPTYTTKTGRFTVKGSQVHVQIQMLNTTGGTAGASANPLFCTVPINIYAGISAIGSGAAYEESGTLKGVFCRNNTSAFYFHNADFTNILGQDQSSAARQLHFNLVYEMA